MATFRAETINVDGRNITVYKKNVEEIFKFGDKPYLCVAGSGGGKTTLCLDIIFKYANQASKIYYVSATEENINESGLSQIPNVFKRTPTFESLYNIWKEIIAINESAGKSINKLIELMGKIYPKEELTKINQELVAYERQLQTDRKITEDDILAWKIEVISREIFNGIAQYGTSLLNEDDMNVIQNIVSEKPKILLFIDDVSAEMQNMATDKNIVRYKDKNEKMSIAYKTMLIDIMTRIRHYNCIMVMFVHNWDTIDVRDKVDNFIVLDGVSSASVNRFKTIPPTTRTTIIEGGKLIFGKYPYHFLVVKNTGENVCVSKADLHTGEILKIDKLNEQWIKCYDSIMKNLDLTSEQKQNNNIDDLI